MASSPQESQNEQNTNEYDPSQLSGPTCHYHHIMKWLAEKHANKPILSYPDKTGRYTTSLTGADLERLTAFAGAKYAESFRQLPGGEVSGDIGYGGIRTKIVAFVNTSTLSSYLSYIALQRIGLSPMLISPRLAEDGYVHLMKVVGCQTVLVGNGYSDMLHRVKKTLGGKLDVVPMLHDDEILAGREVPHVDLPDPCCRPGYVLQ